MTEQKYRECNYCYGSGTIACEECGTADAVDCWECDGKGEVAV